MIIQLAFSIWYTMLKLSSMSRGFFDPCPNVNIVGALMDIEKKFDL